MQKLDILNNKILEKCSEILESTPKHDKKIRQKFEAESKETDHQGL